MDYEEILDQRSNSLLTAKEFVTLLRAQDKRTDEKFDSLQTGFNAAHSENQERLKGIEDKQAIANGSVSTLKAKMEVLEKEREERQQTAFRATIAEQARKSALDGVWIIPKLSWRAWTIIGGVAVFLGYDKIIALLRTIGHFIGHVSG